MSGTGPATRLRLGPDGGSETADAASEVDWSERIAFWVFVAYLGIAWVVLVLGFGDERWFFRDDWDFLAGRDAGDLGQLFEPHGEHLVALPVLVYRLLFNVFGLDFTVFLGVLVAMHLGVAALLRVLMRRAGVGPWIATAAAGALVLFGTGEENIQWSFQIGFVGAVLYGLAQLVLADHDGPIDRRDWFGLLAGSAAVLSAGIGPFLVAAVGLATLLRRGWRPALFHTVPLGVGYATWYLLADPREASAFGSPSPGVYVEWAREGLVGVVDGIGQVPGVAVALAVVFVVGTVLGVRSAPWAELRSRMPAPYALLISAPLFFAVTANGRWIFGPEFARSSRYLYIGAALALPALAWASDAIARRWALFTPVAVALFVVGYPGNIGLFGESVFSPAYFANQRQTILGLANDPLIDEVPPWVRPEPNVFNGPSLTAGFLRDARDAGRTPRPDEIDPLLSSQFPLKLGLVHDPDVEQSSDCTEQTGPVDLVLVEGDELWISGPVDASLVEDGEPKSLPVLLDPAEGTGGLSVQLPELEVRLTPSFGTSSVRLCGAIP